MSDPKWSEMFSITEKAKHETARFMAIWLETLIPGLEALDERQRHYVIMYTMRLWMDQYLGRLSAVADSMQQLASDALSVSPRSFTFTPPRYDSVAQEGFEKLDDLSTPVHGGRPMTLREVAEAEEKGGNK